ncbi:MAG: deoxyribodipyrimidine photo-lyase [Bacteroidia bacterium]
MREDVIPVFIFDKSILDELPEKDARVEFIYHHLGSIREQLRNLGSDLIVKYGFPWQCWKEICQDYHLCGLYQP